MRSLRFNARDENRDDASVACVTRCDVWWNDCDERRMICGELMNDELPFTDMLESNKPLERTRKRRSTKEMNKSKQTPPHGELLEQVAPFINVRKSSKSNTARTNRRSSTTEKFNSESLNLYQGNTSSVYFCGLTQYNKHLKIDHKFVVKRPASANVKLCSSCKEWVEKKSFSAHVKGCGLKFSSPDSLVQHRIKLHDLSRSPVVIPLGVKKPSAESSLGINLKDVSRTELKKRGKSCKIDKVIK